MATTTQTPNMNLIVPTVGSEPGPTYATDINTDFSIIDNHDHSPGRGVQITTAGLNINTDLSIGNNNLFLARSVRFTPQSAALSGASDIGCVYVVGNELYYNDVSGGHQVAITSNGSVNAGAGSITGLPSGTAGVSFSGGAFTFSQATNTPANLLGGSISIGDNTASSKYVTFAAPSALAANYTLTLPTSEAPYGTSFFTIDPSGNMGYTALDGITLNIGAFGIQVKPNGITAAQIANNTITATQIANGTLTTTQISSSAGILGSQLSATAGITKGQLAAEGQVIGGSTGTVSANSGSFVTVQNVSITTHGRPVMLMLQSDGVSAHTGTIQIEATSGGLQQVIGTAQWLRDTTTTISSVNLTAGLQVGTNNVVVAYPPGCITFLDTPSAGVHTYTLQIAVQFNGAGARCSVINCSVAAYEL